MLEVLRTREEIINAPYGAEVITTHTRKLAVSHDLTRVYTVDSRHWNDISIHVRVSPMPEDDL